MAARCAARCSAEVAEPARALAARAIAAVIGEGRSLTQALPAVQARARAEERALLAELAYGALRWRFHDDALLTHLLRQPLKPQDADVHALLLIGLHQLQRMRIPPHAAVSETVAATRALGKVWARGLVNAVLRRFQRERESLLADADRDTASRHAYPRWLVDALRHDWPDDLEPILAQGNAHPPLTLRVNRRRADTDAVRAELAAAGIAADPHPWAGEALVLQSPTDARALPGFAEGRLSVQDAGAQLAAALLDLAPGQRVLDACAAPGGKACHALEREPGLAELVAIDQDAFRLGRVEENLERLGLKARLICGDAAARDTWWDGRAFDRILLDAPCSATGVIRRHPDIKSLRRREDIAALTAAQDALLGALWPLLAPGGRLVYCTCSVLRAENELRLERFLADCPDARALPLDVSWGRPAGPGRQILPGDDAMDGFYYACVVKTT